MRPQVAYGTPDAEISKTTRARLLGLGTRIPELLTQRRFVSPGCHAHS